MSCACPPVVHACISYSDEHVWQELIFPQRVPALPKWEEASADNVLGLLWVARLEIGQPFKLLPVLRKKLFESVIGNMGGVFIWLAKVLKIFWRFIWTSGISRCSFIPLIVHCRQYSSWTKILWSINNCPSTICWNAIPQNRGIVYS